MLTVSFLLATFAVVPRVEWDTAPPSAAMLANFHTRKLGKTSFIVVHHSDFEEPPGPAGINEYHRTVSHFVDIGYHFVVDKDGVVYEGRALFKAGAHAGITKEQRRDSRKDPDYNSIGIVVDGRFTDAAPPQVQLDALIATVRMLRERFGVPAHQVIGHRDVRTALIEDRGLTYVGAGTTCPGDGLWPFLPMVRLLSEPPPKPAPAKAKTKTKAPQAKTP